MVTATLVNDWPEFLLNIEESYERFRKLLAEPDLDWARVVGEGSKETVRQLVEHVVAIDLGHARFLARSIDIEVPPAREFSFDDARQALSEYEGVRGVVVGVLDQVKPEHAKIATEDAVRANVLGILSYAAHQPTCTGSRSRGCRHP